MNKKTQGLYSFLNLSKFAVIFSLSYQTLILAFVCFFLKGLSLGLLPEMRKGNTRKGMNEEMGRSKDEHVVENLQLAKHWGVSHEQTKNAEIEREINSPE